MKGSFSKEFEDWWSQSRLATWPPMYHGPMKRAAFDAYKAGKKRGTNKVMPIRKSRAGV